MVCGSCLSSSCLFVMPHEFVSLLSRLLCVLMLLCMYLESACVGVFRFGTRTLHQYSHEQVWVWLDIYHTRLSTCCTRQIIMDLTERLSMVLRCPSMFGWNNSILWIIYQVRIMENCAILEFIQRNIVYCKLTICYCINNMLLFNICFLNQWVSFCLI